MTRQSGRTPGPRGDRPGQVYPTRRAAIMPQPAAQQLISRPSMATTAPPSPNSKASGKANISDPTAASMTIGASCQIRSRPAGRSSTSTSGVTSSSSGPSGLNRPASCRVSGASCSVSR
jgi:hypothetical protein